VRRWGQGCWAGGCEHYTAPGLTGAAITTAAAAAAAAPVCYQQALEVSMSCLSDPSASPSTLGCLSHSLIPSETLFDGSATAAAAVRATGP
jgi:hypothetical protein